MEAILEAIKDQPLALLAFGVVLALIFGVRYLGLWQGQHSAPKPASASAQVAAVIVDPSALMAATKALEAHTAATKQLGRSIEDLGQGVDKLTDEVIRSAAKLK